MNMVETVIIGSLLHDVGKILHRSSNLDGRAHSISGMEWLKQFTDNQDLLDCVRYHHHQDLSKQKLKSNSPAYAVYIADNISSGIDRRDIEGESSAGFDRKRPQESIYNLLNNSSRHDVYKVAPISEEIPYPQPGSSYETETASQYNQILAGLDNGLRGITFEAKYINSLLELCEAYLSFVPSSTFQGEVADISLFDHAKLTAALAACIVRYLQSQERNDLAGELFTNRKKFYDENAFCLFSCDISGIQQFIYTISSKGALKSLRARSFYLEILLENLVDEIMDALSLARTNVLYTGGGHAYLLLPNVSEDIIKARSIISNINKRLLQEYGTRLFIACGCQECSANELMSKTKDIHAYRNIFRSTAAQISEMKLCRYSAQDIKELNNNSIDSEGRECKICGLSDNLVDRQEETICKVCAAFADISNQLIRPDKVFAVMKEKTSDSYLLLFSGQGENQYLSVLTVEQARQLLKKEPEKIIRIYSKNDFHTGLNLATKLWMGDYAVRNTAGELITFDELAAFSRGIKRIGVLRADVDNMGTAFVNGFIREQDTENKYRYLTLSRTATLSRSLSMFFKYYLNGLLNKGGEKSLLAEAGRRNMVIVYSGGDDLFLVGAWNEVLAAALDIRRAFARYTGNTLTISAGFGVFESGYPIVRMAEETAELQANAKDFVGPSFKKNAISLFGMELNQGHMEYCHCYDWDTFEYKVLGEKLAMIDSLSNVSDEYGNSFLYNILALLRNSAAANINLARLAYTLARREPPQTAPDTIKKTYRKFSSSIYQWALDQEDRRQLITALIIYIYLRRE